MKANWILSCAMVAGLGVAGANLAQAADRFESQAAAATTQGNMEEKTAFFGFCPPVCQPVCAPIGVPCGIPRLPRPVCAPAYGAPAFGGCAPACAPAFGGYGQPYYGQHIMQPGFGVPAGVGSYYGASYGNPLMQPGFAPAFNPAPVVNPWQMPIGYGPYGAKTQPVSAQRTPATSASNSPFFP